MVLICGLLTEECLGLKSDALAALVDFDRLDRAHERGFSCTLEFFFADVPCKDSVFFFAIK